MYVSPDLVISEALREREKRRDVDALGDSPRQVGTEDGTAEGDPIFGTLVPWQVPRPPDAPPPKRRLGGRSNAKPNRERRAYVEQLYVAQYSSTEIYEIVSERFGCHVSTVASDLALLVERYEKRAADPKLVDHRREQMVGTLQAMLHEARAAGDRTTARFVVDKLCRLNGLYAPTKIEATGPMNAGISIEAIARALDEEGLRALELVLGQVERAGIALPKQEPARLPAAVMAAAIDAESREVGDDDDE